MTPEPFAIIPVIPGTRMPALAAGFSFAGFVPGTDYRSDPSQHAGHVTSQRCNLVVIDVDSAAEFGATALGAILGAVLGEITTYYRPDNPDKAHVYVNPPHGAEWPSQWATNQWPYDIKSNGFVRAEPAYLPTGKVPQRPDAELWSQILSAIAQDRAEYARLYHKSVSGTSNPTGSSAGEWWSDDYEITSDNQLTADVGSMVANGMDDDDIRERLEVILTPLGDDWTDTQIQGKIDRARRKGMDAAYNWNEQLAEMKETLPDAPAYAEPAAAPAKRERRFRVLGYREFLSRKPPEWIVDGWIHAGEPSYIAGKPGHGKTLVAIDIAGCVALGIQWHGHKVKRGHVLYVAAEAAAGLTARVIAWESLNTQVGALEGSIRFIADAPQLTSKQDVDEIIEVTRETGSTLVILDTQARMTVGVNENDAKEMGIVIQAVDRIIKETGATAIALHHTPRGSSNLRGSISQEGAADAVIMVSKDGLVLTATTELSQGGKIKDGEPRTEKFAIRVAGVRRVAPGQSLEDDMTNSVALAPAFDTLTGSETDVLAAMRDGSAYTASDLTALLEYSSSTVKRALKSLHDRYMISKDGSSYKIGGIGLKTLGIDEKLPDPAVVAYQAQEREERQDILRQLRLPGDDEEESADDQ